MYITGMKQLLTREIDISSGGDTISVLLVSDSYVENFTGHTVLTDINNELSSASYLSNGTNGRINITMLDATISGSTVVIDSSTDPTWNTLTGGTVGGAIIFKNTGTASTSVLIAFVDLANTTTDGSNLTIQWSSSGILTQANA